MHRKIRLLTTKLAIPNFANLFLLVFTSGFLYLCCSMVSNSSPYASSVASTESDHVPEMLTDNVLLEIQEFNRNIHDRLKAELRSRNVTSKTSYLRPFVPYKQVLKIAPKYKLSTCEVGKCLSTRQIGIFCYLYDSESFTRAGLKIHEQDWHHRFCEYKNEFYRTSDMGARMTEYDTLFVVRDPVSRFVSAYVDKCIKYDKKNGTCNRCEKDIGCTLKYLKEKALMWASGEHDREKEDMDFTLRHFAPQNWYCDLYKFYDHFYFLKYGDGVDKRFAAFLRIKAVPEFEIEKVTESLQGDKRAAHATFGSPEAEEIRNNLLTNRTLLEQFLWFYESDYRIFGFSRPAFQSNEPPN